MGRKRKPSTEELPLFVKCSLCKAHVHYNAPNAGIIYMIDEQTTALCKDCGESLVQVMDIARQRWG